MTIEKKVIYTASNTYSVLNNLTEKTKNVWIVFHGLGYLSKYFINYFLRINSEKNFIIAPQAPAKYYQGKNFNHVGASWLTKENTIDETKNVLAYVDEIYKSNHLILHSGGIPTELKPEDFSFLTPQTQVTYLYGDKDQYITEARKTEETIKGTNLFGKHLDIHVFDGAHEVNTDFIMKLSEK